MDASDVLIGVAVVLVGYLAYQALKPPPPAAATSSSSSSSSGASAAAGGLFGALLGSDTVNNLGAKITQRFNEAVNGERDWW